MIDRRARKLEHRAGFLDEVILAPRAAPYSTRRAQVKLWASQPEVSGSTYTP